MEPAASASLAALRRVASRTTDWRFFCWYWGDAIAIDGLLEAAAVGAGGYQHHARELLQRWHDHCLPNFDDVLAPGAAIVRLAMDDQLPMTAVDRVLSMLENLPRVAGDIPALEPHRLFFRFGLCIDAVYHLPSFYALAGQLRDDPALSRKGVSIAVESMELFSCATGWAQWFDPAHRKNNGISWSRGLGWAVLGLLDLVQVVGERDAAQAADLAAAVMSRLADTQGSDGNWPEVLDDDACGRETSTAAFYVAAAHHPAVSGLVSLPATTLANATDAVRRALADDGTFTGVTADVLPSWDIATYRHCPTEPSPWAQGVALRAFAALARADAAQLP